MKRMIVLVLSFGLGLGSLATLVAQFRIIEPMTGLGNPELKKLQLGYRFATNLSWDDGEFQDAWATSSLAAEGKAPVPQYPGSDDPELASEDNFALILWSAMYAPQRLTDNDPASAWVEGAKGTGIGEVVMVPLSGRLLKIWNGFQVSETMFKRNGRVKKATIFVLFAYPGMTQYGTVYSKPMVIAQSEIQLSDTMGAQLIKLPAYTLPPANANGSSAQVLIAIRIDAVYPGTHYQDTCISEIEGVE